MVEIAKITKYDIPVFEPGDVDPPFIGLDINGQEGRLNLVDYPNRDDPSICCDINGNLYGTKRSIFKIIDDWEDNNMSEYFIPSSSGSQNTPTGASLVSGSNRGLRLNGPRRVFSLPGDGLPYYPVRGDTFEFLVRMENFTDQPAFWRMNFAVQNYNTSDLYRIELEGEPASSSDLSFEKRENGSNTIIRATGDNNGGNLNTTYRFEVRWGFNNIEVEGYNMNGSSEFGPLSFVDGEFDSGGVSFEANGFMICSFDRCRTLPD